MNIKLSTKAQKSLDKVIAQFTAGDLSPITQAMKIKIDDDAPAAKWSFMNQVLAYAQTGELDCRTYKQWQAAGRQVKKGAAGAFIFRPKTIKRQNKETGKDEYICIGFVPFAVFPASATDGDSPLPVYAPVELPPLLDVAKALGIKVKYTQIITNALGQCAVDGSEILLGSHDTDVFFHELGHAVHARIDKLQGGQHEEQETIAELTAATLMDMYGMGNHTGNAWRYISHYAADPLQAIMKASAKVGEILEMIMKAAETVEAAA